jgi:hypothetical protein
MRLILTNWSNSIRLFNPCVSCQSWIVILVLRLRSAAYDITSSHLCRYSLSLSVLLLLHILHRATATRGLMVLGSIAVRQLEQEAEDFKHLDQEFYQRKTKLIPKYQSMDLTLANYITDMKPVLINDIMAAE